MALLNYSTTVPVARTLGEINKLLVGAGARQIISDYDDNGNPIGITFSVNTPLGWREFAIPVNVSAVQAVMNRDNKIGSSYKRPEQVERIAWRIIKDWLEAQMAILRTEMVTLDQVMLPYMTAPTGESVYQLYLGQQAALPAGT